jgi:enamine deaminase RidA (YjgF/YER057c/UK114 family)
MNRIYADRFPTPYPSRTSFGVAFLWKGARVQIDAVARRPGT